MWQKAKPSLPKLSTCCTSTFRAYLNEYSILLCHVFPGCKIEYNYSYVDTAKKRDSIEFDVSPHESVDFMVQIFIPELSLAFEYNGEHHYTAVSVYGDWRVTQQRDQYKELSCKLNGITLIIVPFWWSKTKESIAGTVHSIRPDIELPSTLLNGECISYQLPKMQERPGNAPDATC